MDNQNNIDEPSNKVYLVLDPNSDNEYVKLFTYGLFEIIGVETLDALYSALQFEPNQEKVIIAFGYQNKQLGLDAKLEFIRDDNLSYHGFNSLGIKMIRNVKSETYNLKLKAQEIINERIEIIYGFKNSNTIINTNKIPNIDLQNVTLTSAPSIIPTSTVVSSATPSPTITPSPIKMSKTPIIPNASSTPEYHLGSPMVTPIQPTIIKDLKNQQINNSKEIEDTNTRLFIGIFALVVLGTFIAIGAK
jgi:hypothetical protein